jgi:hypothetical protein
MKVISNQRKLCLRPRPCQDQANFPPGGKINEYGTNNHTPTIVVLNGTEDDPSWQGVDHATGVVIINEVSEASAHVALDIYEHVGIKEAVYYLAISGFVDQYTTNLNFVRGKLSPAGRMLDDFTGIVKRDDRDLIDVWREGKKFCVAPSGDPRVIESEILLRTYRNPDGSEIKLADIPEGRT